MELVLGVTGAAMILTPVINKVIDVVLVTNFGEVGKYLESGKLIDVAPTPESKALVTATETSELTAVDRFLVASTTGGLLMLTVPGLRWVGGAALLGSFLLSRNRDNAKLIGATGTALTLFVTQPVAFASATAQVLGAAGAATVSSVASAVQLSTTVVGVLVTSSGAIVGYLLLPSDSTPKKKTKKR